MGHSRSAAALAALALGLGVTGSALGAGPEHKGCFGYEAANLAQSDTGAMGDHASGGFGADLREGPGRAGIGNVAVLFETNVSDLGFVLGGETCPGRP
jgi:hypothetical protein